MRNLIIKDFLLQKKFSAIFLIFAVVVCFSAAKASEAVPGFLYVFYVVICTYLSILYCNQYEQKRDSEIILNSLPVRKLDIVLSKYIYIIVMIVSLSLIAALFSVIFSVILSGNTSNTFRFSYMICAFVVVGIIYSAYYPLYYKLGKQKMKIVTMILYLFMFMMPSIYTKIITDSNSHFIYKSLIFINNNSSLILITATAATILLLAVSYQVSGVIYKNKDF